MKNKKIQEKTKHYFQTISKSKHGKYFLSVEMESYVELGCLISALIRLSQECLFQKEELKNDMQIDIYNLLDFANKLIPFPELELLDEIKISNE